MKILEFVLKVLARIINIPLAILSFVIMIFIVFIWIIVSVLEFIIVMPIYYIFTGRWYYNIILKWPYRCWFPISQNMENIIDALPSIMIDEDWFDFSKFYDKEKKTENNM